MEIGMHISLEFFKFLNTTSPYELKYELIVSVFLSFYTTQKIIFLENGV